MDEGVEEDSRDQVCGEVAEAEMVEDGELSLSRLLYPELPPAP